MWYDVFFVSTDVVKIELLWIYPKVVWTVFIFVIIHSPVNLWELNSKPSTIWLLSLTSESAMLKINTPTIKCPILQYPHDFIAPNVEVQEVVGFSSKISDKPVLKLYSKYIPKKVTRIWCWISNHFYKRYGVRCLCRNSIK